MQIAKQYWRKFVSLLRKITTPRSKELEHELSALRHDYRELGLRASTMASENDTTGKILDKAKQQIESIHSELGDLYEERGQLANELQKRLESLKTGLQEVQSGQNELTKGLGEHGRRLETLAASIEAPLVSLHAELAQVQSHHGNLEIRQAEYARQLEALETAREAQHLREQELLAGINNLEQRTTEAEQNQSSIKDQNQALAVELAGIQSDFETRENNDRKQLAELALQLDDIEAERASTDDRLQALQDSLTEAASRHSDTIRNVKALQGELEGDRKQHQANLNKVEERLTRIQVEQESLINTQSGLSDSLKKNRRWARVAVGIAFLVVVLAGVTKIRDIQRNAPEVAAMTDDSKPSFEPQVSQQDKPALEEPLQLPVDSVESAAFETQTEPVYKTGPAAGESLDNGTEPKTSDPPPANKAATATSEPLSNKTEPAIGEPLISNTKPGASEPLSDERIGQIGKLERLPEDDTDPPLKHLLTPSQAMAAVQAFEAKAFFEENARKEGVISLPSGLQYKVLRSGHGKSPGDTDMVILHYRGSLPDGREFDSSYTEKAPTAYRVDQVIAGWREALHRMQEGAQWELYIPPALAHSAGTHETPGFLPLIYQLELILVSKAGASR